jgi:hypothetical protein
MDGQAEWSTVCTQTHTLSGPAYQLRDNDPGALRTLYEQLFPANPTKASAVLYAFADRHREGNVPTVVLDIPTNRPRGAIQLRDLLELEDETAIDLLYEWMRPATINDVYRTDFDTTNCKRVLIAAGPTKCRAQFEVLVKQSICTVCMRKVVAGSLRLLKCGACRGAFYCRKKCQVKDWPAHKTVCRSIFSTMHGVLPYGTGCV